MSKLLRFSVSAALLAILAVRTDWVHVRNVFAQMRIELWLGALGLYVFTQFVSARRWQLFARPLGIRVSLGRLIRYYFIGMFFNLMLPTSVGGDVVRGWYLDGGKGRRRAAFLSVF